MYKKLHLLKNNYMPYIFICLSQLMVACNVIASKLVVNHTSFITAVFLRFLFGTLIIFSLYFLQGNAKKQDFILPAKHWFMLILQGLCAGLLFNLFLIMGLQYTSASMAGMLISLLPAVIAAAAVIFLKEKLSFYQKGGIALAILGLLIINQGIGSTQSKHNLHEMIGIILLLLALVPEAAYCLLSKIYQNKLPTLVFAGLINGINAICLLPIILLHEQGAIAHIDASSLEILFLSGVASTIFYSSWSMGIKKISASKAGLLTALNPLMTVILAAIILHEKINGLQMTGMIVVISSIILSNKK